MATWKKIITSGSAAELASLTLDTALPVAQGGTGATSLTDKAVLISQDSGTDAVGSLAMATNGVILVGGTDGPAVEAAADVAGTGLTAAVGNGTLAINVDAAHTGINSILAADLVLGEDAETKIDFETADEIHFDVNNAELLNLAGTTISGSLVSTASFGSLVIADKVQGNLTVATTGSADYLTAVEISGSFVGDGSGLTGVAQDIDTLTAFSGVPHATQDEFLISDNGTELRATMTMVANGAFALVSGDATIAAGGALTIAATAVENGMLADNAVDTEEIADDAVTTAKITDANVTLAKIANAAANTVIVRDANSSGVLSAKAVTNTQILIGDGTGFTAAALSGDVTMTNAGVTSVGDNKIGNDELKQDDDITLQSLTTTNNIVVGGDLTVNGTTTTVATANTKVEDQLMFLATGSAGTNVDAGIMVQSGSVDLSGSAFYHDTNSERWSVAKNLGHNATGITPLQFVTTHFATGSAPSSSNGEYGVGEMWVDTSDQEVYIRTN